MDVTKFVDPIIAEDNDEIYSEMERFPFLCKIVIPVCDSARSGKKQKHLLNKIPSIPTRWNIVTRSTKLMAVEKIKKKESEVWSASMLLISSFSILF